MIEINNSDIVGIKKDGRGIVNGQREKVINTKVCPYNSVVSFTNVYQDEKGHATGTVVGINKILTAWHVAYPMKPGSVAIPGRNGDYNPYGEFVITSIQVPGDPLYFDFETDYAILTVSPNSDGIEIGEVVPILPIRRTNVEDLFIGMPVNLIGYPADKGGDQMWECNGEVLRDDGHYYQMSIDAGWEPHFIAFSSDAVHGNSGGPLLNKDNEIIGVFSLLSEAEDNYGETGWGNGALMMDDFALNWINGKLS